MKVLRALEIARFVIGGAAVGLAIAGALGLSSDCKWFAMRVGAVFVLAFFVFRAVLKHAFSAEGEKT